MGFSERDKLIALAIVHIFETGKPLGDYAACVVLDDGAGVSYGINQFTHRSGSLAAVVELYLSNAMRPLAGGAVLAELLPTLKQKTAKAIKTLSANARFKNALKAAAATTEMREAQREIAFEKYLRPAVAACEGSGFVQPLSLAVVYDSITHGSYERIRDRVTIKRSQFMADAHFEKAWITDYVRRRDTWLESVPRLKKTDYRTDFLLVQIGRENWGLKLPLNVHGFKLTEKNLTPSAAADDDGISNSAVEFGESPTVESASDLPDEARAASEVPQNPTTDVQPAENAQPPEPFEFSFAGYADKAEAAVTSAAEKFDRVNGVAGAITNRRDAAKSLWTTVTGSIGQMVWAVAAFFLGLPREVWIVVAILAGALMLLYLYRQISLGKLREKTKAALEGVADLI